MLAYLSFCQYLLRSIMKNLIIFVVGKGLVICMLVKTS